MTLTRFLVGGTLAVLIAIPCRAEYDTMPPLPAMAPVPADNPLSAQKIALGKRLYFDVRLSVSDKISCNTCHNLNTGGVDHRVKSIGASGKMTSRSTPTVLNAAFQSVQFWDGRADSLEAAVAEHLTDATVMAMPSRAAPVEKLNAIQDYRAQFAEAFEGEEVSARHIAKAVAAYLRTVITPNSAFDRYKKGDKKALSKQALRGMREFQAVGCVACHFGDNFSGPPLPMGEGFYELFPNYLGSVYDKKYQLVTHDQGRFEVTRDPIHKRLFRMPSLRNVALTAPYFHTGTVPTLEEAVRVMGKTQLNKDLTERQVRDIAVFLHSLSGELSPGTMPALP